MLQVETSSRQHGYSNMWPTMRLRRLVCSSPRCTYRFFSFSAVLCSSINMMHHTPQETAQSDLIRPVYLFIPVSVACFASRNDCDTSLKTIEHDDVDAHTYTRTLARSRNGKNISFGGTTNVFFLVSCFFFSSATFQRDLIIFARLSSVRTDESVPIRDIVGCNDNLPQIIAGLTCTRVNSIIITTPPPDIYLSPDKLVPKWNYNGADRFSHLSINLIDVARCAP